jgi:hypothetical protein
MRRLILFFSVFLINAYCVTQPAAQLPSQTPPSISVPKQYTISENLKGGRILVLSDNSVWLIHPDDTLIASAWLGVVNVDIQRSNDPAYPYIIVNTATKNSVRAKQGTAQNILQ